jgi:serine-type D-Ala-D-Ala carboxypeptidase/endopeptidase (penicillin-binding protein 4)
LLPRAPQNPAGQFGKITTPIPLGSENSNACWMSPTHASSWPTLKSTSSRLLELAALETAAIVAAASCTSRVRLAEGVTQATIVARGAPPEVARIEGTGHGEPAVRVRGGRGRARLCVGWTGHRALYLRASVPGRSPSRAVEVLVRPAPWMRRIDRLLGSLPVSVSVGREGLVSYAHRGEVPRPPASNEKLLLSMALLGRFGPRHTIPTAAECRSVRRGVITGDLWVVGHGDPEVGREDLEHLAMAIRRAGVRTVGGSVVGDTSTLRFVSVPTALTFEQNQGPGGFVFDPERQAAAALTTDLRALGVTVHGAPRAGPVPRAVHPVATVRSARLVDILRRQNTASLNFDAEVLDKLLGRAAFGGPGTISKGARAIEAWARGHGVAVRAVDGSGLSHQDRISTDGMVRLLGVADHSKWGPPLRSTLPSPGQGTLTGRLFGLRVRAKTGTLLGGISALSGWVWVERAGRWEEFSVLSDGLTKARAVSVENAVLTILSTYA